MRNVSPTFGYIDCWAELNIQKKNKRGNKYHDPFPLFVKQRVVCEVFVVIETFNIGYNR